MQPIPAPGWVADGCGMSPVARQRCGTTLRRDPAGSAAERARGATFANRVRAQAQSFGAALRRWNAARTLRSPSDEANRVDI
jgi:hypothetical protein